MSDTVIIDQVDAVRRITINRPAKRNALTNDVIARLSQGLREADADDRVRAVVLTGAGDRAFCAGADLQSGDTFDAIAAQPRAPYADMLRSARHLQKPLIARVNGACVAGGLGLVCVADFAIASEDAKFALPEVKIGLIPAQVLALMANIVPDRHIRKWALAGSFFSPAEALDAGLLTEVVAANGLDAAIDRVIEQLKDCSPAAIARTKYVMSALDGMSFEQRLALAEGQIGLASLTADAREGRDAFANGGQPSWAQEK